MCGRYAITSAPEAIRRLFGYADQPNFPPRYNVAPTQPVPTVRLDEGQRRFALVRWGLIPAWVKDPRQFSLLINARGESLNDKPDLIVPVTADARSAQAPAKAAPTRKPGAGERQGTLF